MKSFAITPVKKFTFPHLWLVVGLFILQSQAIAQRILSVTTSGQDSVVIHRSLSILAEAWGGGGKGGTATVNGDRAGGGGGGAYSRGTVTATTGILRFFVGSGSNTTAAGGDSYVGGIAIVMAKGGATVQNGVSGGGAGGLATNGFGTVRLNGGNGAAGQGNNGGGGGSSAGNAFAGNPGILVIGGIAPAGGGGGGNGAAINNAPGNNAPGIGGGGGGASKQGGGAAQNLGGSGGNGQVRITWDCSNTILSGTANQAVCPSQPINTIQYELNGSSGANINWSPAQPTGVTSIYNAGIVTISGAPLNANTFSYTITPLYPNGSTGTCTGGTMSGTISVSPINTAGVISSNTFCRGSDLPANVLQPTTGATGIGPATGLPTGISLAFNSGNIVFSGTPSQSGTFNYSIPLTGGCGNVNATGTLIINDIAAINSPVLGAQTVCIGSPFTPISISPGVGFAYQWYENPNALNSGGTAIAGATSNTFTPPSTTAGTSYYYVVVTTSCGGSATSAVSGPRVVNPNRTATASSSSPFVCMGSPIINITHTTTGATNIGTATGLPTGVTATYSSNTITISGSPSVSGIFNYTIPLIGCGTANATGTITVNAPAAIVSPSLAAQSRCLNIPFNPISVGQRQGFIYQWYENNSSANTGGTLITGATSSSYTPPSSTMGTKYYYVVVSSATCNNTATSNASDAFIVNPPPIVSFTAQPTGTQCVDTDVVYTTQSGQSNYIWTFPGVLGTDYSIVSGGNATSNSVTVRWLTPGNKTVNVNYSDANNCGATIPATSSVLQVQKNTAAPASVSSSSSCFVNRTIAPFTQATTLATGIANSGVSGANGLPLGLSANWAGNTITVSGTVDASVAPGIYNYSIPLTGGCGTAAATGIIDVQPKYELISVSSISPSTSGGVATITIAGDPSIFINGSYQVTYTLGLNNSGTETKTINIVNGKAIFTTLPIVSEDLTSLNITQIKKVTDACFVPITENNDTFFGIKAAGYTSDGIFFVPAGIFEITIKVWGGGGGGGKGSNGGGGGGGGYSISTVAVVPGQQISIFVGNGGTGNGNVSTRDGRPSYVTRNPNDPNPITTSLAYAYGGSAGIGGTPGQGGGGTNQNGQNGGAPSGTTGGKGGNGGGNGGLGSAGGSGSGNRPGMPGDTPGGGGGGSKGSTADGGNGGRGLVSITYPLPPVGPCFKVIDDGSRSGMTIIEFTCNTIWRAPRGLLDFDVYVGGAGGGGGSGSGAGGGGSGGLTSGLILSNNSAGFNGSTSFNIFVGAGGEGSLNPAIRGSNGNDSSISGVVEQTPITFSALGGGGGGSEGFIQGQNGARGGGGGASNIASGSGGNSNGGSGSFDKDKARAGGGGGGLNATDGIGGIGKAAGSGQGEGGSGGHGIRFSIGDTLRNYGAGGGGVGFQFNGTPKIGLGGTVGGVKIGGDGNLTGSSPAGFPGVDKTGSGGGAGYGSGGKGGNGVVYIYYQILRILPVEYIYIKAEYQTDRSSLLTWATAKERENSHFEIERSIDNIENWIKVGEVKGAGNSDEVVSYQFKDQNLPSFGSNVYYRLRQFDIYENSGLSKVVSVRVPEGSPERIIWKVYPNPTQGRITIAMSDRLSYREDKIQVRIISMNGQAHYFEGKDLEQLNGEISKFLEDKIQGVYILEITSGPQVEHFKILKN